ncbi:MAG TPA: hypothetical protein VF711_00165 [Acidimicrobiales bacterium]
MAMTDEECCLALGSWATQVFDLNPALDFELDDLQETSTQVWASLATSQAKGRIVFRVLSGDELLATASEPTLGSLRLQDADVTVVAIRADPFAAAEHAAITALQLKAGAPVPTFIVMDPEWLAAAVVSRSKPFAFGALTQPGRHLEPEPYFPEVSEDGPATPKVTRARGTLRAAVSAKVIAEAASLPEKRIAESVRIPPPIADLTIVTTFLPPVTHSRRALTRYYSRDDDIDTELVENQINARQDYERTAWSRQLQSLQLRLIIDRQQLEEYCAAPEYYQMYLTPDELDEQIAAWTEWFDSPNLTVALSPEPIDIPFTLQGNEVTLRGDRRNRSEPRPGRLSGMRFTDRRLAEEFRRESWSLMQLTEPDFKNKAFIEPWIKSLCRAYRTNYRRWH